MQRANRDAEPAKKQPEQKLGRPKEGGVHASKPEPLSCRDKFILHRRSYPSRGRVPAPPAGHLPACLPVRDPGGFCPELMPDDGRQANGFRPVDPERAERGRGTGCWRSPTRSTSWYGGGTVRVVAAGSRQKWWMQRERSPPCCTTWPEDVPVTRLRAKLGVLEQHPSLLPPPCGCDAICRSVRRRGRFVRIISQKGRNGLDAPRENRCYHDSKQG